jgi:acyl-ACP thioesterase
MAETYNPRWEETFQVRSFDLGLNRTMRLSSLCSYFQEVAGKHATHLNVGYRFVQQSGMVWVLSRLFMNIRGLPGWGDTFTLETWPLGNERFFYRRDYRLTVGQETLVSAASYWILLDLATRRPKIFSLNDQVILANTGRYSMQMPAADFETIGAGEAELHRARYSDLDQNRHVNNARYVEWIFDLLDQEVVEKNAPSFFAIEYKHEVKGGDTVMLRKELTVKEPLTYAAEGNLSETGQVCFRAKIIFG